MLRSIVSRQTIFSLCLCGVTLTCLNASPTMAGVAYSQNFDSGSATYTANDPYWLDTSADNGIVKMSTDFLDWSGDNPPAIAADVSGSGYFLFLGTGSGSPTGNEFFISPTFAVTPNTNYAVSFYLTNANGTANAQVEPQIDGSLLGTGAATANGFYQDGNPADQWQQYTFNWNSGSNTSGSLILHDYVLATTGNDFGIDDISVATAVPEPSAFALLSVVGLGLLRYRRSLVKPVSN